MIASKHASGLSTHESAARPARRGRKRAGRPAQASGAPRPPSSYRASHIAIASANTHGMSNIKSGSVIRALSRAACASRPAYSAASGGNASRVVDPPSPCGSSPHRSKVWIASRDRVSPSGVRVFPRLSFSVAPRCARDCIRGCFLERPRRSDDAGIGHFLAMTDQKLPAQIQSLRNFFELGNPLQFGREFLLSPHQTVTIDFGLAQPA